MRNKTFGIIMVFSFLALLSACASVEPMPNRELTSKHILEKNYELGKRKSVYIGEEIVKVKDYKIWKWSLNKVEVLNDFKVTMPFYSHIGSKGDKYQVIGMSKEGNNNIYLIQFPDNYSLKWGLNSDGYFADYLLGPSNDIRSTLLVSFEPKNTRFKAVKEEKIDVSGGYINYEIIYSGITGQSINLLYREYTSENIARVAFYQNLTYPIGSKIIRFKKIKIEVDKISNESIEYTVIEDGLKK